MNNEYRLLPVALAPHIKDALVETGGCFMPETVWAAIIAAHELVAPSTGDRIVWQGNFQHVLGSGIPAYRKASAAPVLTDADKQDAERWRAFLNSARIRIIGTAGIREPEGGYAHLGMEIWTIYGASLDAEQMQRMRDGNAYAREVLTKYADIAIERHLSATPAKTEG